jgi:hypothetical protein
MKVGVLLVLFALFMAGCGGSSDYSANFIGTWRGKVTTTLGAESEVIAVVQPVTATGSNQFTLNDWVSSTVWTADGSDHASVQATKIPTQINASCTYDVSVLSGHFVRQGNGARFAIFGSASVASGCGAASGTSYSYSAISDVMQRD